jgi:hypothetical protein
VSDRHALRGRFNGQDNVGWALDYNLRARPICIGPEAQPWVVKDRTPELPM